MDATRNEDITYYTHIVQTNVSLPLSQHNQFWTNLSNINNATRYLTVLLAKLYAIDLGDRSPLAEVMKKIIDGVELQEGKTSSANESTTTIRNQLINTLYFLALYYPFDETFPHFRTIITKWTAIALSSKGDFVGDVANLLNPSLVKAQDSIFALVDLCSNIEFDTNAETFDPKSMTPSFVHSYLRHRITNPSNRLISQVAFDTIFIFLKHPLISERKMLALLHMLRQWLTLSPHTPREVLESAMAAGKTFFLWPQPFGEAARELLQMITVEMKAPGAALRKRILDENPHLAKGVSKTGKERTVHLLVDRAHSESRELQEFLRIPSNADFSPAQLQLNLLTTIFATVLGLELKDLPLERLSRDRVERLYDAAIQILNEAVLMKQENAEKHRVKALEQLLDNVRSLLAASDGAPTGFDKASYVELPPLNFQFIPFEANPSEPFVFLAPNLKYPRCTSTDLLATLLGQYAAFADSTENRQKIPTVKVALLGSDAALHNVVGGTVAVQLTAPRSLDSLKLQFYPLPGTPSLLGDFLSRADGWWGRHVLGLARSVSQVFPTATASPANRPSDLDSSDSSRGTFSGADRRFSDPSGNGALPPLPTSVFRSEMENYFREAKWRLEINVYQCECWMDDNYWIVPFALRLEVGVRAYARTVQRAADLPNASLSTLQNHKTFKWSPPALSLRYTQMNLLGVPRQGSPLDNRSLLSLVAANIPISGDRGVAPNPTKPWLEMTVIESDKKRKNKPDKDLETAPFTSLHVNTFELEADDKKKGSFYILLDNVLYGPVTKIKVSPCGKPDKPITFPVMTFLPLDLP